MELKKPQNQGERLKFLTRILELKASDCPEILGVEMDTIYRNINGKTPTGIDVLHRLIDLTGVSADWFITGKGVIIGNEKPFNILTNTMEKRLKCNMAFYCETVTDLAVRLMLPRQTVYNLLSRSKIDTELINRIGNIYEMDLNWVIGGGSSDFFTKINQ